MSEPIPFLDLRTPHRELEAELIQVVQQALRTAHFVGGPMVEEFERAFAEFCSTRYCVGVGSGTDALRFALIAAGIGSGDSVVTVPNTFIGTTEAITQVGATPEFVDIDERTYNMDFEKLREFLEIQCTRNSTTGNLVSRRTGKRVAAVIPVHLYGQMADMDPILALAEKYKLVVIEDACQAHGAEYFSKRQNRWCRAGSMGRAGAFSFYPGKNLGACGEAGAVTTNDEELAQKVRMLRDHGQAKKYYHEIEGYNGRLDAIQAGILRVKLNHLADWNEKRRHNASIYTQLLTPAHGAKRIAPSGSALDAKPLALGVSALDAKRFAPCAMRSTPCAMRHALCVPPYEPSWSKAVYHLYVIRVSDREGMMKHLAAEGIATGIHYPIPLHLQTAYRHLGYSQGDFPVTERVAAEILSLPMFPTLTPEQQGRVAEQVLQFSALAPARVA
jgi:dTDP-4-amino-4,6-dideoxygalactose transaminase